jgi:hypothetical protein
MTQPGGPSTATADKVDVWPVPREVEDPNSGLVAIDFGTSSSTVTLWDASGGVAAPMPPLQLETLRLRLADFLETAPPASVHDGVPPWTADVLVAAAEAMNTADPTMETVLRTLRMAADMHPNLAHRILLELDLRRRNYGTAVADWLSERLHDCYDEAFGVVALEPHHLHPVELGDVVPHEIPSRLEISRLDPLAVRLGRARLGDDDTPVVQSLKNHMIQPRPVEYEDARFRVGTDALLGAAFGFLLDRADAFVEANSTRLDRRPLDTVVLTYPTMSPPPVRRRLHDIAQDRLGIGMVDVHYDEAVAASLFFLMRELSGDYAIGVEALRSRMRPVPGPGRCWRENVLVIDIGGGTTDIALLRYELVDRTPVDDLDDPFSGRRYQILPRVLGSSGKARRGGDFLTLQVFHWIKAVLADRLLSPTPSPTPGWENWQAEMIDRLPAKFRDVKNGGYLTGSLVEETLTQLRTETANLTDPTEEGTEVRPAVDGIVHTRWLSGHPQARYVFWSLWEMAETAKKDLGRCTEAVLHLDDHLTHELVKPGLPAGVDAPADVTAGLELGVEEFRSIVRPMLQEVTTLARSMAMDRLQALEDEGAPARLDRIILTGKASQLPLVQEVVAERFGHLAAADGERGWRTDEVMVESRYPKQAASIGAAWAASRYMIGTDDDHAPPPGETSVTVTVNNLFHSLPCAFARLGNTNQSHVLLRAGTPFTDAGEGGLRARARAGSLPLNFYLQRIVDGGGYERWGSLRLVEVERRYNQEHRVKDGPALSKQVWPREIQTMVEVDPDLNAWLLMWRGDVPLCRIRSDDVVADVVLEPFALYDDPKAFARAVRIGDRPVFAGAQLHGYRSQGKEVVPIMVGAPVGPPSGGGWSVAFDGAVPGAVLVLPGEPVDGEDDTERFTPFLEAGGRLRLYRGQLPFVENPDASVVEEEKGVVLRWRLNVGASPERNIDDPFCGVH